MGIKISKNPKTKKYDIYYNEEYCGALSEAALLLSRIKNREYIEKKELDLLVFEGECSDALNYLLSALSNMMTEQQARLKLQKKGYTPRVSEFVIKRVKEYGYINDEEFAKNYIESNINNKGKHALRQALLQKGVDDKIIEKHIDDIDEFDSCIEALKRLIRLKKIEKLSKIEYADKAKIIRSLLYKGYSYDTIKEAFSKLSIEIEE